MSILTAKPKSGALFLELDCNGLGIHDAIRSYDQFMAVDDVAISYPDYQGGRAIYRMIQSGYVRGPADLPGLAPAS
jgi:hypothetical protein